MSRQTCREEFYIVFVLRKRKNIWGKFPRWGFHEVFLKQGFCKLYRYNIKLFPSRCRHLVRIATSRNTTKKHIWRVTLPRVPEKNPSRQKGNRGKCTNQSCYKETHDKSTSSTQQDERYGVETSRARSSAWRHREKTIILHCYCIHHDE